MSQEHLHYDIQLKLNGTVINKCWPIRQALVVVIILLYILTAVDFSVNWSYMHCAFVENRKSFWTVYSRFGSPTQSVFLWEGVTSIMGTILTDLYMVHVTPWELIIIHISSSSF